MSYAQHINKILHKKFIKKEHFMKFSIRQFHKMLFFPVYYGIIVVSRLNV